MQPALTVTHERPGESRVDIQLSDLSMKDLLGVSYGLS